MEKRTPHYPLSTVKDLIRKGSYRATRSALLFATNDFGLLEAKDLAQFVLSLENKHFHKSMTTIHDNKLWQDVYRLPLRQGMAYVKIQILEDNTIIISFKRL